VTGPPQANSVAKLQGVGVAPQPNSNFVDGEVLSIAGGQWTRGPLPSAKGDVDGPWDNLTVKRLGGVALPLPWNLPNPAEARFLRVAQDTAGKQAWELATIDLKGDVNGSHDKNTVAQLQGYPVQTPSSGTVGVLNFDGAQFKVVPTPAVIPPAPVKDAVLAVGSRSYQIIAAGNLKGDGTPLFNNQPVLGGLRLTGQNENEKSLVIEATQFSRTTLGYGLILKVVPVDLLSKHDLTVTIIESIRKGFVIRIAAIRSQNDFRLADIGLSIEISAFEV
jgi:hypothetical protein